MWGVDAVPIFLAEKGISFYMFPEHINYLRYGIWLHYRFTGKAEIWFMPSIYSFGNFFFFLNFAQKKLNIGHSSFLDLNFFDLCGYTSDCATHEKEKNYHESTKDWKHETETWNSSWRVYPETSLSCFRTFVFSRLILDGFLTAQIQLFKRILRKGAKEIKRKIIDGYDRFEENS